jgi:Peroxide stress protein YaaA
LVSQPVRILLSFAEAKAPGGRKGVTLGTRQGLLNGCFKAMMLKRTEALQAFRSAMNGGREAQAVLGLKGQPFQDALAINRGFDSTSLADVLERSPHAFLDALTKPPLSAAVGRRLHRDVLFVCPLLGLLRPGDQVPDYRCPVGAQLPRIGSLHRFWKETVTAALNRLLKGAQVFSFLPARLSALWEPDGREAGIAVLRFSRLSGGRCVGETASVPRLSGEAVRYILENEVGSGNELMRFRSSRGHAYSASHSEDAGPVRHLNFVLDPAAAPA